MCKFPFNERALVAGEDGRTYCVGRAPSRTSSHATGYSLWESIPTIQRARSRVCAWRSTACRWPRAKRCCWAGQERADPRRRLRGRGGRSVSDARGPSLRRPDGISVVREVLGPLRTRGQAQARGDPARAAHPDRTVAGQPGERFGPRARSPRDRRSTDTLVARAGTARVGHLPASAISARKPAGLRRGV